MSPWEFPSAWRLLRRYLQGVQPPWVEALKRQSRDPYQVLISCVLSLRTQDSATEGACRRLFALARSPQEMVRLPLRTIQKAIYPVGFYRIKARNIKALSRLLLKHHQGLVPQEEAQLLALPGVGRKTANLVLSASFRKAAICVDTHVHRITNRWGLVSTSTPHETELALKKVLPKRYWRALNPTLVVFGQRLCRPLRPYCSRCPIRGLCGKVGVESHR